MKSEAKQTEFNFLYNFSSLSNGMVVPPVEDILYHHMLLLHRCFVGVNEQLAQNM